MDDFEEKYELYTQLKILKDAKQDFERLAKKIAEDRKEIFVNVFHEDFQPPEQMMFFGMEVPKPQESIIAEPISFLYSDEQALGWIGMNINYIEQTIQQLEKKL